jgi:GNAT superfamily N-acetyltransferase
MHMEGTFAPPADQLWSSILPRLDDYRHDHYYRYPARTEDGWKGLLRDRLVAAAADPETELFFSNDKGGQALVALRTRSWDEQHFGFRIGTIELMFGEGSQAACRDCLVRVLEFCGEQQLRFVSARVNGDHLDAVHALEDLGFRYIENIIWPVADCRKERATTEELGVRLLDDEQLERVASIAEVNQYQRGHYHCDPKFPLRIVDSLYARWVRTAHQQKKPILVVEHEGGPAGYFVLDLPADLSASLGYRYGGMRSLGLQAAARGKGLGRRLFWGAVAWLRDQGCDYVDSGYATKNHLSARLHQGANFNSAYEEVTMHRWLQ